MIFELDNKIPKIDNEDCFIAHNATVIGSVIIKKQVSIWFNAVIRADNDLITIDSGSNIQDGCVLHTDPGIRLNIGSNVTVGHQAMLHGCTIQNNTLIGIGAVILNRATIGQNCIIGAKSLILENTVIPDGSLVVGSPGKVIRKVTTDEIEHISWAAKHYIENYRRFKKSLKAI